jgi:hypothetical protein
MNPRGKDMNPFDQFENLDDLLPAVDAPQGARGSFANVIRGERKTYTDKCDKCRGSGRFIGYSGRDFGPCFKCKGKGTVDYKSSPTERATKREQAEKRRVEAPVKNTEAFKTAHPTEFAWLMAKAGKSDFALSLLQGIAKYGSLTEKQLAAVQAAILRDTDRAANVAHAVANAKVVDVSKIEVAFATCRAKAKADGAMGVRWPKLRLDTFTFTDAPASERFAAAILVKEGDQKLGRIQGGKFIRSFACDDPTEARVVAAAADPAAAAVAYGQKYSRCSICGLELTNDESIKRGIGPICAEKFGF